MSLFAVLVENDESQWEDRTGESYHFPHRYKDLIPPGTRAIYYKGKIKDRKFSAGRLSDDPHYFGVVVIGQHRSDPKTKGAWYAAIENYQPFAQPVPIRQATGEYFEEIPSSRASNYWRDGVRAISADTYERIVRSASFQRRDQLSRFSEQLIAEDASQDLVSGVEGHSKQVFTTVYERDPALRREAIRIHGVTCAACGFNFEDFYGEYGAGFIHVHHMSPIAQAGGPVEVVPAADLVPLCPNCHAMIHRRKDKTLSVAELVEMVRSHKPKS